MYDGISLVKSFHRDVTIRRRSGDSAVSRLDSPDVIGNQHGGSRSVCDSSVTTEVEDTYEKKM